jgi:hypothetical protein
MILACAFTKFEQELTVLTLPPPIGLALSIICN